MVRSVKKSLVSRLISQAQEADLQGLTKIADVVTNQVQQNADNVRDNEVFYSYSADDFSSDLENQLWGTVIRVADFYNIGNIDAKFAQELVERTAQEMTQQLCKRAGINHGVGAYEEGVPGEKHDDVMIEVEEE